MYFQRILFTAIGILLFLTMSIYGQNSLTDSMNYKIEKFNNIRDKIYGEIKKTDTVNKEIIAGYYYEIATMSYMLDSEKVQMPRTMAYIDTALTISYMRKNIEFRGFLNLMSKNYAAAVRDFKNVEKLDTTAITQTWYYIAAASFELNNNATACEYMKNVLEKGFDDGLYYIGKACRECSNGLEKSISQELYLQLVYNYLAEEAVDYAQEVLKKMKVVYPENSNTYLANGYYFLYNNNMEASIKELNAAVKKDANNAAANYLLSRIYLNQNKYKESEKSINAALKTKKDNPSFFLQRARVNFASKDNKSALKDCSLVKELNSSCENGGAYLITAMIYITDVKSKDSKKAEICNNLKMAKLYDPENGSLDGLIDAHCGD